MRAVLLSLAVAVAGLGGVSSVEASVFIDRSPLHQDHVVVVEPLLNLIDPLAPEFGRGGAFHPKYVNPINVDLKSERTSLIDVAEYPIPTDVIPRVPVIVDCAGFFLRRIEPRQ